jgi:hypothetical protein
MFCEPREARNPSTQLGFRNGVGRELTVAIPRGASTPHLSPAPDLVQAWGQCESATTVRAMTKARAPASLVVQRERSCSGQVASYPNESVLGDGDHAVTGLFTERNSHLRLSDVAIANGKTLGLAVVLQNQVLANFQPVPPIWPQGARFCADNTEHVKGSLPIAAEVGGAFGGGDWKGPPGRAFLVMPEAVSVSRCRPGRIHAEVDVDDSNRSMRAGERAGSTVEALLDVERTRRQVVRGWCRAKWRG